MNQQQHRLMQVLQKIPIFKGLELVQIQRILRVGTSQKFSLGEQIYTIGEPSLDMLVLLQGRLAVTGESGELFGEIGPGMLTGEMGVFTNHPRSANISATENSVAVIIEQRALKTALASDQIMHVRVLENLVEILSERLLASNETNDDLHKKLMEAEGIEEDDYGAGGQNHDGMADEYDEYPGEMEESGVKN